MVPTPSTEPPRSRTDAVTSELRAAILARRYQPGERLRTDEVAEAFGVSPTPVREAFARLAGEGLLEQATQRGVRVARMSVQEMRELYELRLILEPIALSRSIKESSEDWSTAVRSAERALRQASKATRADNSRYAEYEDAHVALHVALLAACDSETLVGIVESLTIRTRRYRTASLPRRGGFSVADRQHREIVNACLDRDADRAVELLLSHLQDTADTIEELARREPSHWS